MNFVTTTFPNFGSGRISRLSALWRRDISLLPSSHRFSKTQKRPKLLGPFRTIFRSPLFAVFYALRVEHTAEDVIAHARKVFHAAAADHHHRMLLEVMTFAGNVADHFKAVGQPNLGDLAQRRIRLLRRRRIDARANAPLLRALLQSRHLLLGVLRHPRLANELVNRRHRLPLLPFGLAPIARRTNPSRKTKPRRPLSRCGR